MKVSARRHNQKSALEMIEEAVHLLRQAPISVLAAYAIGTLPFVVALLYFCTDMSFSAFARERVFLASLALALAFFWMKIWQALFGRGLQALVAHEQPPAWNARSLAGLVTTQIVGHAAGLFLVPLALIAVFPFGWVYAFFQDIGTCHVAQEPRQVFRGAYRRALAAPAQNHSTLALLSVFGLIVFFNCFILLLLLPLLAKTFFGVETEFTRSSGGMLNSTLWVASGALAYICTDPIVKCFYVLRCFYLDSLHSGLDLRSGLRVLQKAAVVLLLLFLMGASPGLSQDNRQGSNPQPATAIQPPRLEAAIQDVLQKPKYAWRMPKEKEPSNKPEGSLQRFFNRLRETLSKITAAVNRELRKLLERLFRSDRNPVEGSSWMATHQVLLWTLLALTLLGLAVLVLKRLKDRPGSSKTRAEPLVAVPNLNDEQVSAEQLPEDGWMRLGNELLEQGELRLALRAFFLSALASLARRNLISLAKFKSNRDYYRELKRRAQAMPQISEAFAGTSNFFESIWYGQRTVDRSEVLDFARGIEELRAPR